MYLMGFYPVCIIEMVVNPMLPLVLSPSVESWPQEKLGLLQCCRTVSREAGNECLYIWLHCVKLMVAVSLCLGVNICKLFIRTAKCCLPGRWRIQEVPPSPSPAPTDPCVDLEGACLSQRVDCRSWHCGAGIDLNQSAFNSRQETVGWIIELSFVLHM